MAEAVAIVAGATGLVGQTLVRELAAESSWREVRALRHSGRQPTGLLCPWHDHATGWLGRGVPSG
jgi:hypothetical protein